MTSDDEIYYDPFDFDVDVRAHEVWRRMRDEAPLYRNDAHDFYALTRYDDVLACLLDTDTYVSRFGTTLDLMGPDEIPMPMFIFRDPPEHTLLRKLVSRAFTPRRIDGLEARIERVCGRLLDPLDGLSTFDFVNAFSSLLPPTVILALLGFPEGLETEMRASVDNTLAIGEDTTTGSRALIEGENVDATFDEPAQGIATEVEDRDSLPLDHGHAGGRAIGLGDERSGSAEDDFQLRPLSARERARRR